MHIPDDPCFYEKFYFTPGDSGFQSFPTRFGRVGVLICWDQWFPEAARLTALSGAQFMFFHFVLVCGLKSDRRGIKQISLRSQGTMRISPADGPACARTSPKGLQMKDRPQNVSASSVPTRLAEARKTPLAIACPLCVIVESTPIGVIALDFPFQPNDVFDSKVIFQNSLHRLPIHSAISIARELRRYKSWRSSRAVGWNLL